MTDLSDNTSKTDDSHDEAALALEANPQEGDVDEDEATSDDPETPKIVDEEEPEEDALEEDEDVDEDESEEVEEAATEDADEETEDEEEIEEAAADNEEEEEKDDEDEKEDEEDERAVAKTEPKDVEPLPEDLPCLSHDWHGHTLRVVGDWTYRWFFLTPTYSLYLDNQLVDQSSGPRVRHELEVIYEDLDEIYHLQVDILSIVGVRPEANISVEGEIVETGRIPVMNILNPLLLLLIVGSVVVMLSLGPEALRDILATVRS